MQDAGDGCLAEVDRLCDRFGGGGSRPIALLQDCQLRSGQSMATLQLPRMQVQCTNDLPDGSYDLLFVSQQGGRPFR